jgi:phosphoglycolate phosphatase
MPDWSQIKGLLFDKDGTLIDFFATWIPAYCMAADRIAQQAGKPNAANSMLLATGYNRPEDYLRPDSALAGGTNQELIDIWRNVLGDVAPVNMEAIALATFTEHAAHEVLPTADMPMLCGRLREKGFTLGIATNDDLETASWTADYLKISHHMAFVTGADAGHGGKPGPGMGLAFCAETGLSPHEVAMVGDSAADSQMARAAGFGAAIGVCTGAAPEEVLRPHFDVVLDSVALLPNLLWNEMLSQDYCVKSESASSSFS